MSKRRAYALRMSKQVTRKVEVEGGRLLRSWRAYHGLSQRDLAKLIASPATAVCEWENGDTPSLRKAALIERVTGGAVPAVSWVDPATLGQLGQEFVKHTIQANESSATAGERGVA